LLLFALCVFGNGVLPVTAEHGVGFAWTCLTVGEYS
jgi:galactitol-specific phosphotransferase system IIC component